MSEMTESLPVTSAPQGADYFSVFALPRKLDLDTKAHERAFYRKSREVHPDRFAQASPEKQQWSLDQTSLLNDAYRALKDPIARTEYLLRLEGVTLPEDNAVKQDKKNVPPELLAEVFELNMQLEEMRMNAKTGEDDPQLRADLEAAQTQFEGQLKTIDEQIRDNWRLWDGLMDVEDEREQGLAMKNLPPLLDKRRYVRNLVRDVREALGAAPERVR
jgi:molecular chaperone HscB